MQDKNGKDSEWILKHATGVHSDIRSVPMTWQTARRNYNEQWENGPVGESRLL